MKGKSKRAAKRAEASARSFVAGHIWGLNLVWIPPPISQAKRRRLERGKHR